MKRDMDLCRRILFEVEQWETTLAPTRVEIDGYTADEIGYNAWLLADEGLIEGHEVTGDGDAVHQYWPSCLTYRGHDFLEYARNDTRWKKATQRIMSLGGAMTTQAVMVVLKSLLTNEMNPL
ncbi:MAG: DUF2513 domain-containing protein [Spirochaetaceae bacterium]|nr:DUF2513 domain-containing protein [Spirochaetaceae bacterium]